MTNPSSERGLRAKHALIGYRIVLLSVIGAVFWTTPIVLKIFSPLILVGFGGYLRYLKYGKRPPLNSSLSKFTLFFEIWLFFWNGFVWTSYE